MIAMNRLVVRYAKVATRTSTDTASAISSGAEEGTEELPLLR